MNAIRDVHDQAHVVLDQHNGDAVAAQTADDRRDAGGLHRIAAGRGLVEQKELGLARQCTGQFEALEIAERQAPRGPLRRRRKPDPLERGRGSLARDPVLPPDRGQVEEVGEHTGRFMAMAADHDVLEHAHAEENLQVLERARQAATREVFRRKPCHVLAGKAYAAPLGLVKAGDDVEQRRLSGAVGADDRKHEARGDGQAHVIDRTHAAEGDRQMLDDEYHARPSARARVGTMPARKKIITAIMMRPSAMCS